MMRPISLLRRMLVLTSLLAVLCSSPSEILAADAAPHADGHAVTTDGATGHAETHETGVPMSFKSDLTLWSLVTFLLFVVVLAKVAWAPLATALNEREAGVRAELAAAESNRASATALLKDYEARLAKAHEEVVALLAEARRDAEHTKQQIISAAQNEAEATRDRALADIARARDTALGEMFDFVSRNVVQATEQVLQRSLTGDDQERLVREALASMDVRKN